MTDDTNKPSESWHGVSYGPAYDAEQERIRKRAAQSDTSSMPDEIFLVSDSHHWYRFKGEANTVRYIRADATTSDRKMSDEEIVEIADNVGIAFDLGTVKASKMFTFARHVESRCAQPSVTECRGVPKDFKAQFLEAQKGWVPFLSVQTQDVIDLILDRVCEMLATDTPPEPSQPCTCGGIAKDPDTVFMHRSAAEASQQPAPIVQTDARTYCIALGRPHLATAFRGPEGHDDDEVCYQIGRGILQLELGLATVVESLDADLETQSVEDFIRPVAGVDLQKVRDLIAPYANDDEWSVKSAQSPWRLVFNSTEKDGHGFEGAQKALEILNSAEKTRAVYDENADPYLVALRDAYAAFDERECDGVDECKEALDELIWKRKETQSAPDGEEK